MRSIGILRLHKYLLENFNISNVPLCAIEALRKSLYWENFDRLIDDIDLNIVQIKKVLDEKYNQDDALKSYAIIQFVLKLNTIPKITV